MTIRVYRVRADGTTATIRERQEIDPAGAAAPIHGSDYPPCCCPRCRDGGSR